MKLTKSKLKQLINEELEDMQQEGLLDMFSKKKERHSFKPKRRDFTHDELHAKDTSGELPDPADQAALDASIVHLHSFLEDSKSLNNVERYKAMEELMRELSNEMIWRPSRK